MLAFAAVDGSFMGLPLDAIFVSYVYNDRSRFLLYVLLASAGSALGSIVLYVIGYAGGEVLLRKRLSPERFEKIHASFEHHEFWALMFPAMLPPPTPFKIVVLAAAASEMNFAHFLLAIFAGRFVRFLIEALLAPCSALRIPAGVAPCWRARIDAAWMVGPSITGSENGMPISMASAPAAATARTTSTQSGPRPPVT